MDHESNLINKPHAHKTKNGIHNHTPYQNIIKLSLGCGNTSHITSEIEQQLKHRLNKKKILCHLLALVHVAES